MSTTFTDHINFSEFSSDSSEYVKKQPVDLLRFTKRIDPDTEEEILTYHSDVALLLNTERIVNQLGIEGATALYKSLHPVGSPYRQGNYTDEQLESMVKSRFIQRPSEIVSWFQSLVGSGEQVRDDYAALRKAEIDAKIAEEAAKQVSSETKTE